MDAESRINEIADTIANEGMVARAARVREGAVEISRQRHEIELLRAVLRETIPHVPANLLRRIETMLGDEQEARETKA